MLPGVVRVLADDADADVGEVDGPQRAERLVRRRVDGLGGALRGRVDVRRRRRAVDARAAQGSKRVIQRRFNVSVPRARVPEKASMLRDRSER